MGRTKKKLQNGDFQNTSFFFKVHEQVTLELSEAM